MRFCFRDMFKLKIGKITMLKSEAMPKKKSRLPANPFLIEYRTPFPLTLPLFLWTAAVIMLYYTAEYFRDQFQNIAYVFPNFTLLKLPMLLQYAKHIGILAWLLLLGAGIGFFILRKLKFEFASKAETIALSLGLGWGIMGLGIFALGLMRILYAKTIISILAILTLPAAIAVYQMSKVFMPTKELRSAGEILLRCFLFCFLFLNLLGCFMPETFYDALVYHLAVPGLYLKHHGVTAVPQNLFSGIPMLVEMLYGIGLVLGSDETAHVIHTAFGFFSAVLLVGFFERFLKNRKAGLFAAVIFYSTTLVAILSWKSSIDLGWTFFQFAAVYALAVRINEGPQYQKWTWLAGVFTGFAMGTKYTAWPLVGILSIMLMIFKYREDAVSRRRWLEPLLFTAIALSVVSLWPVKNVIFYGNPIYPFFHERFACHGALPDWKGLVGDAGRDLKTAFLTWTGFKSYLMHPWTELAGRRGDVASIGVFPLLVIPFFFLVRFKNRGMRFFSWSAVFLWFSWSISTTVTRFFVPLLPLISAVLVYCFEQVFSPRLRRIVYAAVIYAASCQLLWSLGWLKTYNTEAVIFGSESKQSYLSKFIPSYPQTPYPAIEFINKNLPQNARVLFIGEQRGFYMERDYVAATVFDIHPLLTWIRDSETPDDLLKRFKEAGITHMLLNKHLLIGQHENGIDILPLNERESAVFAVFQNQHLKMIFEKKPQTKSLDETWVMVLEII